MSTTRRICPEAFKREAVDRVHSSGLSVEKVAIELGVARDCIAAVGEAVLGAGDGDGEAPHNASAGPVAV